MIFTSRHFRSTYTKAMCSYVFMHNYIYYFTILNGQFLSEQQRAQIFGSSFIRTEESHLETNYSQGLKNHLVPSAST